MRVAVASGKGGTGKTLVSTSLAWLLARDGHRVVYVDADVEEPNGHLFLHPEVSDGQRYARPVPELKRGTCSGCGECQSFCQFNAIVALRDRILLFPELCSSCGGCVLACRDRGLFEVPREIGTIEAGTAGAETGPSIRFLAAALDVGEARATPLIRGLLDRIEDPGIALIDAPAGTSCSVMEIVGAVDRVVLVTEPTPSGEHDLERVLRLLDHFRVPAAVLINKHDLSPRIGDRIEALAREGEAQVVGRLPFSPEVPRALARGELPLAVEAVALPLAEASRNILGLLSPGAFDRAEGFSDFVYPPPLPRLDPEASPSTAAEAATAGGGAPALGGVRKGPRAASRPPRRLPLAKRSPG